MEHLIDQGHVYAHISADQVNIPVAAAGANQFHHLLRCAQDFSIGRFRPVYMQMIFCGTLFDLALEKLFPHRRQRILFPFDPLDCIFHPGPAGAFQDLLCCLSRFFKCHQLGADSIAV